MARVLVPVLLTLLAGLVPATSPAAQELRPEPVSRDRLESLLVGLPGVFRVGPDHATIQWVARRPLEARVRWGRSAEELSNTIEVEKQAGSVEVLLEGLPANAEVWYACSWSDPDDSEWLVRAPQSFRTARDPGDAFRFAVVADSHLFAGRWINGLRDNVGDSLEVLGADDLDFVVLLGGEVGVYVLGENPRTMNQRAALVRWHEWRHVYAGLLESTPTFLGIGIQEGEAGYLLEGRTRVEKKYWQRWGTVARKQTFPNPLPTTYPAGGEDEGWEGPPDSPGAGGGEEGNRSPLQNYYAFEWGDALVVVLDVYRYTNPGGVAPTTVDEWTLGGAQLEWLERTLDASDARWKFVMAHHVLGGADYDAKGMPEEGHRPGRGGARYALRGEQERVTALMREHDARFFVYAFDKVFAHQAAAGVEFVTCGRLSFLQASLWETPGWREAYPGGEEGPGFVGALGYTRFTVAAEQVQVEFVRTAVDLLKAENVEGELGASLYRWNTSEPSPSVQPLD